MARRRSVTAGRRVDISPVKREYLRVWGKTSSGSVHPFGPGRPFPDFESWCVARAALVDHLDAFGLTTEDFKEIDDG